MKILENDNNLCVTILAGGLGKRMNSDIPKVLCEINGIPMIVRLLRQVIKLNPCKIYVVVGSNKEIIRQTIERDINFEQIVYVVQEKPLGTGDAVKSTLHLLSNNNDINMILNADVPMLSYGTLQKVYNYYNENNSKLLITSINLGDPTGNGRIIIDANGIFQEIIEQKDCNNDQLGITLVNCGIYVCRTNILQEIIPKISCNNVQNEYYLTDLVKIYRAGDKSVDLYILDAKNEIEIYNVNTQEQLKYIQGL